jgi:energy-coupling factor transport system substrate-specific component
VQYPVRARLTARDLVSIGIYSVLIRLITMIVSIPFTPFLAVTMPFISGVCAFFSAPVYLLMAYKVGKRGVMMLLCAVMGLSYVLMGYGFMLPYLSWRRHQRGGRCPSWPIAASGVASSDSGL